MPDSGSEKEVGLVCDDIPENKVVNDADPLEEAGQTKSIKLDKGAAKRLRKAKRKNQKSKLKNVQARNRKEEMGKEKKVYRKQGGRNSYFLEESRDETGQTMSTVLDMGGRDVCLQELSMTVWGKEILQGSELKLIDQQRYGLVGANGVGKTQLMRRIADGSIVGWPKHIKVYLVAQESEAVDETVFNVVMSSHVELEKLKKQEADILAQLQMLSPEQSDEHASLSKTLDDVYDQISSYDEPNLEKRAKEVMKKLKLTEKEQQMKVCELSGGWRMRVALACALLNEPDILLLDEPGNHLDLPSLIWLQQFLTYEIETTLLIVSHDRHFLNAVCTDIIHFFDYKLKNYNCTGDGKAYDQFEQYRNDQIVKMQRIQDRLDSERAAMSKQADAMEAETRRKGGDQKKSAQVAKLRHKVFTHGMHKTMHGSKIVRHQHGYWLPGSIGENGGDFKNRKPTARSLAEKTEKEVTFKLYDPAETGLTENDALIEIRNVCFSYQEHPNADSDYMFQNLNLRITMQTRMALLGMNGLGKSTILKLLAGELEPSVPNKPLSESKDNTIFRHRNAVLAYFSQHHIEDLQVDITPVDTLVKAFPELASNETEVRVYLGRFGITKSIALQQVGTLSGGQKTRLVLALVTYPRPHILVLDEPTNHLDASSIAALSAVLKHYKGAVVTVSHDRQLIYDCFTDLYVVEKNTVMVEKKKSMRQLARDKRKKDRGEAVEEQASATPTERPLSRCRKLTKGFDAYLKSLEEQVI